jgi:predicted nucleic acid-binding protein
MTGAPAAPEIIDLEFLQTLRRHVRLETMTLETADSAARLLPDVPLARSSHRSLLRRVWELRHSITAYDAAYVALAEELQIPLVTCDSKLAGSNSHKAEIELYPAS